MGKQTKEEKAAYNKAYHAANRERLCEEARARYHANRERCRAQQNEYHKRYYQENKPKILAKTAKRRGIQLQRTPPWACLDRIEEVYELAELATEVSGVQYHVDHIVPLQGATVSGLHIYENLQVIPATENLSKGNKYDA